MANNQSRRLFLLGLGAILLLMISEQLLAEEENHYRIRRKEMVERQLIGRGIKNKRVLKAMLSVKRHLFVPNERIEFAYLDQAVPIEAEQTISQPYIVALMTELAEIQEGMKVLEIGTGSGYQAAVLSSLGAKVFTIEIIEELFISAKKNLEDQGFTNILFRHGDGYIGWPEEAPFDAIIVTAAPDKTPQALIDQIKIGGKMIIPVGAFFQNLYVYSRDQNNKIHQKSIIPVRFVPMVHDDKP